MNAHGLLSKEAALRSTVRKMEDTPGYTPRTYAKAGIGVRQLKQYIEDLKEVVSGYGEGDS